MSNFQPGAPRRRRIAGERRGRTLPTEQSLPVGPETDAPPAAQLVAEPGAEPDVQPVVQPAAERPPVEQRVVPPVAPARLEKVIPPAAVPDEDVAATDDDEPATGRATGWWGSRPSLISLAGALVVLLTLVGLAALGLLGTDGLADLDEADAADQATRTAPAAAEAAAAAILAYDFRTLDADQDGARRFMTDDFASEYSETFEKVVQPAAEQNRARVTASVLGSATVRATEDTARVVLFVDQTTVSKANPRPQIALNRVEMSMVRSGDSWLVADITSY
jgi:Mce-associated membrane protein